MAIQNNANIRFEKQIWDAACVLWGHIPAAEYRKVIVGLIFLRYISNAFEKRYQQLVEEGDGFEDDKDAYAEDNIFFVPEDARWSKIASAAHTPEIGTVIDDAMRAIEKENTTLKNVLPKNYASPDLDKRVLGEVVDLFTNMDMGDTEESKDLLGRTYEYCIQQFAAYEGVKGGEFYTPASIVKTIDQLYGQFVKCKEFLRQEPVHAESREHLKSWLAGRQANGIIFTTMQKFEESFDALSERRNIVVMADEAHRGQYGLAEKIKITKNEDGEEVAKRVVGIARIIRNSLPRGGEVIQ